MCVKKSMPVTYAHCSTSLSLGFCSSGCEVTLSHPMKRTEQCPLIQQQLLFSTLPTWHFPLYFTCDDFDLSFKVFKVTGKQSLLIYSFSHQKTVSPGSFCHPSLQVTELEFTKTGSYWLQSSCSHTKTHRQAFWQTHSPPDTRAFPSATSTDFSQVRRRRAGHKVPASGPTPSTSPGGSSASPAPREPEGPNSAYTWLWENGERSEDFSSAPSPAAPDALNPGRDRPFAF